MIFIGIDGGLDGCVSAWDPEKKSLTMIPIPFTREKGETKRKYNVPAMADIFMHQSDVNVFVVLEKAQAMPGQGVSSMFSIGYGYGIWHGVLTALGIKFVTVHPRKWQKMYNISSKFGDTKQQSFTVCCEKFPKHIFQTVRGRILDGQCDASLIALYAQWYFENEMEVKYE